MRKRFFVCAFAVALGAFGLLAGCGEEEETERKLRDLPADVKYEYNTSELTVSYTDSAGKDIELYGEMYMPVVDGKLPVVIFSHGFNGHYNDFSAECRRLAERGYLAYGFDFCGAQANGRSTGRTAAEYTPFTMKEDLLAVIRKFQAMPDADSSQIFLWGGSQGGFVTALAAADPSVKNALAAIALYFPAFNIPDDWNGSPEVTTPLMGYSIGAEFIHSVQDLDPYAVIGDYPKDVCIVWGTLDDRVKRTYIDRAVETYGDRAELTVLEGAGHGFGGAALTKAIDTVLAFFEARTYA